MNASVLGHPLKALCSSRVQETAGGQHLRLTHLGGLSAPKLGPPSCYGRHSGHVAC